MDQPKPTLTDDQKNFLRPAITKISEGFAELHNKLSELGWEKGDFGCNECDCEIFQSQPPDELPSLLCARSSCGHFFPDHRVL